MMKKTSMIRNHLRSAMMIRMIPISAPLKSPLRSAAFNRYEKYPNEKATIPAASRWVVSTMIFRSSKRYRVIATPSISTRNASSRSSMIALRSTPTIAAITTARAAARPRYPITSSPLTKAVMVKKMYPLGTAPSASPSRAGLIRRAGRCCDRSGSPSPSRKASSPVIMIPSVTA